MAKGVASYVISLKAKNLLLMRNEDLLYINQVVLVFLEMVISYYPNGKRLSLSKGMSSRYICYCKSHPVKLRFIILNKPYTYPQDGPWPFNLSSRFMFTK